MYKISILALPTLLMALLMSSCLTVQQPKFKELKNVKMDNVGLSGITVKGDVIFMNPNNFGFQIKQTDLEIYINNNLMGTSKQDLDIQIPRNEDFIIPLVIDINGKNILKAGLHSLFDKDAEINVKGSVLVRKSGITKNIPVDYKSIQKIPFF
ncbi:MAG: LEA type 2 family protein [Ferruginibacter sp.]|nr:LEA type 2 family protein [Ferruginibacter sp.]